MRACARGFVLLVCLAGASIARAETLNGALARAYSANPNLAAGRAGVRAIDESVPQALAGLRPQVSGDARLGVMDRRNVSNSREETNNDPTTWDWVHSVQSGRATPRTGVLSVEQPVFDGFKTQNATRSAQSGVLAARQRLRLLEQRVLLEAVTAYMDVLRESAAVRLQQNNVQVLTEQLRQTARAVPIWTDHPDRHRAGRGAPRRRSRRRGRGAAHARGEARTISADHRRGAQAPRAGAAPRQAAAAARARRPKRSRSSRIRSSSRRCTTPTRPISTSMSPRATSCPRVSVLGNVFTQTDLDGRGNRALGASLVGRLSVPFYDGGLTPSRVRQAKEVAGQRRRDVDAARAEVHGAGARQLGRVGRPPKRRSPPRRRRSRPPRRRSTACARRPRPASARRSKSSTRSSSCSNARLALLTAQRDRVVASYAVLGAVGRLSAERLDLGGPDLRSRDPLRAGEGRLDLSKHAGRELSGLFLRLLHTPKTPSNLASRRTDGRSTFGNCRKLFARS